MSSTSSHPYGMLALVAGVAAASYFGLAQFVSTEGPAEHGPATPGLDSVFSGRVDPALLPRAPVAPLPTPAPLASAPAAETESLPETSDAPAAIETEHADTSPVAEAEAEPDLETESAAADAEPGPAAPAAKATMTGSAETPAAASVPVPAPTPARTAATAPPDAGVAQRWWPATTPPGQFGLSHAGQLSGQAKLALSFTHAVDVDSGNAAIRVLGSDGALVIGQWTASPRNPRMLLFAVPQAGRYTVIVGDAVKDQRGSRLGLRAQGPVYVRAVSPNP